MSTRTQICIFAFENSESLNVSLDFLKTFNQFSIHFDAINGESESCKIRISFKKRQHGQIQSQLRSRMTSTILFPQHSGVLMSMAMSLMTEEEDLVMITREGRKVAARSKILGIHSSLFASLIGTASCGSVSPVFSVDASLEEVSALVALMQGEEVVLESKSMLDQVGLFYLFVSFFLCLFIVTQVVHFICLLISFVC